jgi:mono/diheme cytochrome c family protein
MFEERSFNVKKVISSIFVILTVVALSGCSKNSAKPNIEVVQDMMDQPAIKAQGSVSYDPDKSGMGVPPEGTVPLGYEPYPYATVAEAERGLKNPFAGNFSAEVMTQGRIYFQRYCLVCHGEKGDGKGPVSGPFNGTIKTLISGPVLEYSDQRIFHIITAGQGIMGSYLSQIPEEENRWAIVNYVRSLQGQAR